MMIKFLRKAQGIIKNEFWNKLLKNFIAVLTGSTSASAFNFLTMIMMIRVLGDNSYAVFVLAQQYMSLLDAITNFQAWQGVIKFGTEAMHEKKNKTLCGILKGGFLIDFLTAVTGTIVAFVSLLVIKIFFEWSNERIVLSFIFSIEIIFHIEGTSIGILRLFDKFKYLAVHSVINAVINLISLGIYFAFYGDDLYVATLIYVITDIIKHLSLVVIALKILKKNGFHIFRKGKVKAAGKNFFKFTVWTNLSSALDVPVQYLDIFIVNMISLQMVSIYKVFKQMTKIISSLTKPLSQSIMPQLSQLVAENKSDSAFEKVIKIRNLIFIFLSGCILVSLFIGKPIMNYFLNESYGNNTALFILMLATYGIGFSYVAIHPFFLSLGKAKEDAIINLVTNCLYILLAYYGVRIIGVYGMVLATFLQIFITVISKTILIKRELI